MKKIVLTTFFITASFAVFSQNDSTKIETYVSFLGYQYIQNENTILMPIEMLEIFENHPAAFNKMKQARSKRMASQIFFSTGAIVIGYAIVSGITKNDVTWQAASAGAALVLIGIPFNIGFHRNTQAATAIFNDSISQSDKSAHLELGLTTDGLGLTLKF